MRRLVGMLRSDEADDPLAPQPGLADLPTLVDAGARGGPARSSCRSTASAASCPVGIELSAYRIVQEALTNALKHAGGAHAAVHVRYGADSLELEIADDGGGGAAARCRRRPRPGRDARARRALRRPPRRRPPPRAAASPSACCCRSDDDAS